MFRRILALIPVILMPCFLPSAEQAVADDAGASSESSEVDPVVQAFLELDWKRSGTHKLPKSNSTISLPDGYLLLIGDEVRKEREICKELFNDSNEALVYDSSFENCIFFDSVKDGHVSIDDWGKIDPKSMLQGIIERTEKANEERRENGVEELHVVGWMQEPTLDKHTNTVYLAIEGVYGGGGGLVNSVAIRLSRHGFERVTWVTSKESYVPFGGHLDVLLRAHSFDPGFRYKDYTVGDSVAGYGIATLVAATIGAKVVKVGGFALLFKKGGALIIAAITAFFYKVKSIFTGKKEN